MAPTIITIGLPWDHSSINPALDGTWLRESLEKAEAAIRDAGVKDYKALHFGPEDGVQALIDELKQRRIDGVVIGMGVRGNPALTPWFEDLVNAVRETSPSTKLLFNTSIDNPTEAIKRSFKS